MNNVLSVESSDPYLNLGREELLLNTAKEGEVTLYLWQNAHTVVIGKNQNPWRECDVALFESENGKLARRSSGGGAVYHDMGNLNFTFIAPRELYDVNRQLSVILAAVRSFGIDAVFSGRNDLLANGKKFSGNAFQHTKSSALHHGTLLLHSDMQTVARYLSVSKEKMQSKGIASVASRVCNLRDFNEGVGVESMKRALAEAFAQEYGESREIADFSASELSPLRQKYASWDWRYGESPKFDIELENRFPWGEVQLALELNAARVVGAKAYSDAMDEAFIGGIGERLQNVPFHSEALHSAILEMEVEPESVSSRDDLAAWLLSKGF